MADIECKNCGQKYFIKRVPVIGNAHFAETFKCKRCDYEDPEITYEDTGAAPYLDPVMNSPDKRDVSDKPSEAV